MQFDYSKLKGRIIEKFETYNAFADAMNFSKTRLSQRLNNEIEWKPSEIYQAAQLLGLEDVTSYFFKPIEK